MLRAGVKPATKNVFLFPFTVMSLENVLVVKSKFPPVRLAVAVAWDVSVS